MKPDDECHRLGVLHFEKGEFARALEHFRKALAQSESAEFWSDWASAQFAAGNSEEAEVGLYLALEIDPAYEVALVNLSVVLLRQNRGAEALPFLEKALAASQPEHRPAIEQLLAQAREAGPIPPLHGWEAYLRGFLRDEENERSYFQTHLNRYLQTLALLPDGSLSSQILELGVAFHHVTPALHTLKHFGTVRCNDIWSGTAAQTRHIASSTGESFDFPVDNFDVQSSPWPYNDACFDAVLCCEMLEHLHTDPMGLVAEINRVLKPGGLLLLTTPNVVCTHALDYAMKGESPYVYGKFERGGAPTDRHNREYTATEVGQLAQFGGFHIVSLKTNDSWWPRDRNVLRLLAAEGHSIARRGDNTFLLARKEAPIAVRYPVEFYQTYGTQSGRRMVQGETHAEHSVDPIDPGPQKILVIHDLLPHFDRSGSDLRLMDVLRELHAQGHALTFIARDGANADRYRKPLEDFGVSVLHHDPEHLRHLGHDNPTNWLLNELLAREQFDVAILCHWFWSGVSVPEHYLQEIRRASPHTSIAILTDDRHGERERRSAAASGLFSDFERGNDFEAREIEAYRRADLVLYITEADHQHFRKLVPDLIAEHLPILASLPPSTPPIDNREGVLFLGNFENPANRDALEWLLKDIWPRVRKKRSDLKLYIAGHGAPQNVADARAGIVLLGHVPDLADAFSARLIFAGPIRFGTGINTKNMQSLAHGLPVVTTSVGAEGMGLQHEVHALVSDDASSFADSIMRLTADPSLWTRLANSGRDLIRLHFSLDSLRPQVRQIIARATALTPKPAPTGQWSYRRVEGAVPAAISVRPVRYRLVLRTLGYWQLGSQLLQAGQPAAALEQFRHIFTALRGAVPATCFHRRLLLDMHAAYTALDDSVSAQRCKQELTSLVSLESQPVRSALFALVAAKTKRSTPKISVVLPTFNRMEILRVCLAAFAFQTLPESLWEVIVIDDGSEDETESFCQSLKLPYTLQYLRQANAGAGAARRAGVEAAHGEFVLLCNDDSVASSTLLSEHLRVHLQHPREKWAVLGQFQPSELCAEHALSHWYHSSPFLFPQHSLRPGQLSGSSLFVTCNLSLRRDAILKAGNFDSAFRVGEDTDLGVRLASSGYSVFYHPAAHAVHEHSQFTVADLLRRAQQYGAADWLLFQKHPHLLATGKSPFGTLSPQDFQRIESSVQENSSSVASAISALEALDRVNLLPFFEKAADGGSPAEEILQRLSQIVPLVYWQTLFESFLAARDCAAKPSGELTLASASEHP
jgi:GT2 family glycosyltransferase/SAM-dependent methyltransferase